MRRPSPLQTTCVHQDILNRIFHSNLGMRPVSDRLTLATFPYFREKKTQNTAKFGKGQLQPCQEPVPFPTRAGKGGHQPGGTAVGRARSSLCRSLHPFLPRLGLNRLKRSRQDIHPPRCKEFIPEMPVFPSTGCPPSPGSRVPAPAAAWPPTPPPHPEGISSAGTNLARTPFPRGEDGTFLRGSRPLRAASPNPRGAGTTAGGGGSGSLAPPTADPSPGASSEAGSGAFPAGGWRGFPPPSGSPLTSGDARPARHAAAPRALSAALTCGVPAAIAPNGTTSNRHFIQTSAFPGSSVTAASALSRGAGPGLLPWGSGEPPLPYTPALPPGCRGSRPSTDVVPLPSPALRGKANPRLGREVPGWRREGERRDRPDTEETEVPPASQRGHRPGLLGKERREGVGGPCGHKTCGFVPKGRHGDKRSDRS